MTEKESTLEQAVRQVAESKRFIAEQRQRIEKLRASGISTLDAEQTLDVLSSTLKLLENHERYVRQHTLKTQLREESKTVLCHPQYINKVRDKAKNFDPETDSEERRHYLFRHFGLSVNCMTAP